MRHPQGGRDPGVVAGPGHEPVKELGDRVQRGDRVDVALKPGVELARVP